MTCQNTKVIRVVHTFLAKLTSSFPIESGKDYYAINIILFSLLPQEYEYRTSVSFQNLSLKSLSKSTMFAWFCIGIKTLFLVQSFRKKLCSIVMSGENLHQSVSQS